MNIEPQNFDHDDAALDLDGTFADAYDHIQSTLAACGGTPLKEVHHTLPRVLHHSVLRVVPALFQPRIIKEDADHVADLRAALIEGGKLDAVKVFPVGEHFYLVDGHHRVAAYREAEEARESDGMVPVSYLASRHLDDAITYAAKENAKARKRLERWEIQAWTWDIVKSETKLSKASISKLTGTSTATVGRMRAVLGRIQQAVASDPRSVQGWEQWTWTSAQKWDKDHIPPSLDEVAEAKKLQQLYGKLEKAFGPLLRKSPERIFRAIMQENEYVATRFIAAAYDDGFLETALSELGPDEEENPDF